VLQLLSLFPQTCINPEDSVGRIIVTASRSCAVSAAPANVGLETALSFAAAVVDGATPPPPAAASFSL
jgi:hypothetical protein